MRFIFLVITFLSCFSQSAENATLFLVGHIPVHFDIRVDPVLGILDTLDIENGEVARKVATVSESSNNVTGYAIFVESINAGNLLHQNATSSVSYQIKYGVAGALVSPPAVGAPLQVKTSGPLVGLTFGLEEVFIDVTAGGTSLPAGAYTDTLIFSMQAL